jgi:hypothetical protein
LVQVAGTGHVGRRRRHGSVRFAEKPWLKVLFTNLLRKKNTELVRLAGCQSASNAFFSLQFSTSHQSPLNQQNFFLTLIQHPPPFCRTSDCFFAETAHMTSAQAHQMNQSHGRTMQY